jgi:hypothetical protein
MLTRTDSATRLRASRGSATQRVHLAFPIWCESAIGYEIGALSDRPPRYSKSMTLKWNLQVAKLLARAWPHIGGSLRSIYLFDEDVYVFLGLRGNAMEVADGWRMPARFRRGSDTTMVHHGRSDTYFPLASMGCTFRNRAARVDGDRSTPKREHRCPVARSS